MQKPKHQLTKRQLERRKKRRAVTKRNRAKVKLQLKGVINGSATLAFESADAAGRT